MSFRSSVVQPARVASMLLAVAPRPGGLLLNGRLSSGSTGWRLAARVTCFRRTVTVEVNAARGPDGTMPGVEDHQYEVEIEGLGPGKYLLKINHVWLLNGEGEVLLMPAWEGPVTV